MKKSLLQHIIAIATFLLLAIAFSFPAFQGKKLSAGDTIHWMGMSEEARAWYEKTGENPMWSNSMFGGMPTVTHYMRGKTNLIYPIQEALTNMLPSPVFFFFIAMLCFYVLSISWRMNRWIGIAGAIMFAFASYNLQIIAAGHNTKMFSIGYMPLVLAGMHWIYQRRYLAGAGAALVGLALMISNAMYQIDYYLLIILLGFGIAYLILALKQNTLKQFALSTAVMLGVGILSVGPSLDQLMLTQEYTSQTMRGGQSELTLGKKENKKAGGLDKDYAFSWSQGIGETFTLLVPNLYGGGSQTNIGTGSSTYETLTSMGVGDAGAEQFVANAPTYWGPQPFLSGPNYLGAIIIFLFVLGFFVIRSPLKWAMVALGVIGIMLSWGKHFPALNFFLFDHLPLYNKFRTPSMAMVIPAFMICLMAMWALHEFLTQKLEEIKLLDYVKKALIITGGLCLLLGVGGRLFLDFRGENDDKLKGQIVQMMGGNEQAGQKLFSAIVEDRPSMAMKDGMRSLVFIFLAALVLWFFAKRKLDSTKAIMAISLLMIIDLLGIGTRYLNSDNYVEMSDFEAQFSPRPVDMQIKQDPDPYFRVFDLSRDPFNDAMGAYHHKLVGGYHPAKMERYQDMIDNHLSGNKLNAQVLNMLNTKYIIFNGQQNQTAVQANPDACGNAWFVENVRIVKDANEEMLALDAPSLGSIDTTATFNAKTTAVVQQKNWNGSQTTFAKDESATLKLTQYGLNKLSFESNNTQSAFAVFSDVYYPLGWKAYIDGKESDIIPTNYVLRGLHIPAGKHQIEFVFHPDTYFKWGTPTLISSILILLVLAGGIGLGIKNGMQQKEENA